MRLLGRSDRGEKGGGSSGVFTYDSPGSFLPTGTSYYTVHVVRVHVCLRGTLLISRP